MKIALTVWQGRISPVFESAQKLVIFEIREDHACMVREETFRDETVEQRIARLQELGIDTLVCGAVSREIAERIESLPIRLFSFVAATAEEALSAYLSGCLLRKAYRMPGCHRIRGQERSCAGPHLAKGCGKRRQRGRE